MSLSETLDSLGIAPEQFHFISCLLLSCPLAAVYRYLPHNPSIYKHLYSIVGGILVCAVCLGPFAWLHAFISSAISYILMKFAPHGLAHKLVFIV